MVLVFVFVNINFQQINDERKGLLFFEWNRLNVLSLSKKQIRAIFLFFSDFFFRFLANDASKGFVMIFISRHSSVTISLRSMGNN
jgi:hypothetical protein